VGTYSFFYFRLIKPAIIFYLYRMKLCIIFCLVLFFSQSFCQIRFPEVYCNGEKLANDQVSGYFSPLRFEFKFQSADTSYVIKEGKIMYVLNDSKDSVFFSSNKLYSDVLGIWDNIIITINKVDVFSNKQLIRTDSLTIEKKIKFNHLQILSQKEAHIINDNEAILYVDGAEFDMNKPLTRKYRTFWQVALKKKGEEEDDRSTAQVKKWDLLLVRGNKPIFRLVSDGIGHDVKDIWKIARRGDFIRLAIKVKGLPQKYLYKIIFIE
jgi:hypothetical protein